MQLLEGHSDQGTARRAVFVTVGVAILGLLVLSMLALTVGTLVTHFVVGHAVGRADTDVARWFADHRTGTWNSVSVVGSYLAETVTVVLVLALALTVLAVRRDWPQFGMLVVALSVEPAVYLITTYVVSRHRPPVPRLEDLIVSDSFPSGHTAAAVALYASLAVVVWSLTTNVVWRGISIAAALLAPLVVGLARVYRGMHNPTDVLAGALIGAGCVVVGYVAVRTGLAVAEARRIASVEVGANRFGEAA